MNAFERIDWSCISFNELETVLQINTDLSVDIVLSNKLTPLCLACKFNREDLVTVLLLHGADPNKTSNFLAKTPLHFACDHGSGNIGIVRKLIAAKADLNAIDEDGNTGLHLSCSGENVLTTKLLLDNFADVDHQDVDGETPLMRACLTHNIEIIEMLLSAGGDPNLSDGQALGFLIRSQADQGKAISAIHLLMNKGADVHQGPFLAYACEQANIELMKILHHYGADVEKANILGMTPLHTACFYNPDSPMHLLLKWGALVNACSEYGKTPLHYACSHHDIRKINLLLAYGANLNALDVSHNSPLITAIDTPVYPKPNINWTDTLQPIVSLLLAAGTIVSASCLAKSRQVLVRRVTHDVKTQQLLDDLYRYSSQPKSLQSLCRITIRAAVSPDIDYHIELLPLPVPMKEYLKFSDIIPKYEKAP